MDIKFERVNTEVKANIDLGIPVEKSMLPFTWSCGTEYGAQLLRDHLGQGLFSLLQRIRREEYEAGWKDAKGRKQKRDWFSGYLKCN